MVSCRFSTAVSARPAPIRGKKHTVVLEYVKVRPMNLLGDFGVCSASASRASASSVTAAVCMAVRVIISRPTLSYIATAILVAALMRLMVRVLLSVLTPTYIAAARMVMASIRLMVMANARATCTCVVLRAVPSITQVCILAIASICIDVVAIDSVRVGFTLRLRITDVLDLGSDAGEIIDCISKAVLATRCIV